MAQDDAAAHADDFAQARAEGRRQGLATAALAMALVAYLNLLGAEKSILAIVLGAMALAQSAPGPVRRRAGIAIALAALHLVTLAVVLVLFRAQLGQLLHLLHKLG